MPRSDFAQQRASLVRGALRGQGITSEAVLAAMGSVPREAFTPREQLNLAYRNMPIPLGFGQTISQPWIVACMAQAMELSPTDRVLEIGTGSGYAAAVFSRLAADVYSIERIPELAEGARETLGLLGFANVFVKQGDGTLGWPEAAPFDAIAVAAGGPRVPPALRQQLALGGRLVMPVGDNRDSQKLLKVTRSGKREFKTESLVACRFVPLIGVQGWQEEGDPN